MGTAVADDVIDTTAVELARPGRVAAPGSIGLLAGIVTPGEILAVMSHVHAIVKGAMKEGIDGDYGLIPGTGTKKVLLKPGAEKLLLAFSLTAIPRAPTVRDLGNDHREIVVETEIRSMTTNRLHAVGLGSCSTMEKKYRWRPGPVEITDQPVPSKYWDLRKSDPKAAQELLGGPGHSTKKDENGSWMIALKGDDVAENSDIADVYNTVLKMASKRSMVDGTIRATGTSGLFTQDLDDELGKKPEGNGNGAGAEGKTGGAAAATVSGNTVKGIVTSVTTKAGKNNSTNYGIIIGGNRYGTFSDTIGKAAQALVNHEAIVTFKQDGKWFNAEAIAAAGESAAAPVNERTAEDEALDRELAEQG